MTDYHSARFQLPLLAAGQAHKELFHNEAIMLVDFLISPVVEGLAVDPDALSTEEGKCWVVATGATGDWEGQDDNIAAWTENGWQFISPVDGMRVLSQDSGIVTIFRQGSWQNCDAIAPAAGGTTIDSEARAALDSILIALQTHAILPEN
ncbi:MAG: DUF2793 domain-containing protein [Pseudomonadota bacterium]